MRYSTEEINRMSYLEWMETIAKELNAAGFKGEGYNAAAKRFMKNVAPYDVHDVNSFFMGSIDDSKAMDYLKIHWPCKQRTLSNVWCAHKRNTEHLYGRDESESKFSDLFVM